MSKDSADIMVCSECGHIIAKKKSGLFDIFDCGWECPNCKEYWLSSHGWLEVGNLLIPYRSGDLRQEIPAKGRD